MTDQSIRSADSHAEPQTDSHINSGIDPQAATDLAYRQAVAYGRDLARVYSAEKQKRQHLELAYQLLNAVFSSTPEGTVVLDREMHIQQANGAFTRLLDLPQPPDSLAGVPISQVMPVETLIASFAALESDPNANKEIELTLNVGAKQTPRLINARIARLNSGNFSGWLLIMQDRSRQRRIEQQKSEFITLAADELNAPLKLLRGRLQALQRNESSPDAQAFRPLHLMEIEQSAERLAAVVNDIMRFAEVNQGTLASKEVAEVDLFALVNTVLAECKDAADLKLVTLQVMVNAQSMISDYAALRRILVQLVANGINFNYSGGTVRIEVNTEDRDGNRWVVFEIADTGIGVPQDEIDSIFEPFYRVDDPMVKQSDGLGLGLSMVKRAVDRLNGTIHVYSSRHPRSRGTRFTVRIPHAGQSLQAQLADLRMDVKMQEEQAMMYAKGLQELYRELKVKNDELQVTNHALEQANAMKSDFLGVIGHELRSPFVGLDGAIQTFKRAGSDSLSAEQAHMLSSIEASAKSAFVMVDRLVKYTQFMSKQGVLRLEAIHMAPLLGGIIDSLRGHANRRKVTLNATYAASLVHPRADVTLIGEAVFHLVQNGIKFTEAGGSVTLNAYEEEGVFVVEIVDTGVGVPVDRQTAIWDSFAQLADPLQRGVEGLGLGLPLVKYVATAHNGEVFVQSEPGRGSVFGFWMPVGE